MRRSGSPAKSIEKQKGKKSDAERLFLSQLTSSSRLKEKKLVYLILKKKAFSDNRARSPPTLFMGQLESRLVSNFPPTERNGKGFPSFGAHFFAGIFYIQIGYFKDCTRDYPVTFLLCQQLQKTLFLCHQSPMKLHSGSLKRSFFWK